MIARLFFKLTGGRPMIDEGFAFVDVVSRQSVRYFRDRLGRRWLADSGPWSRFRVPRAPDAPAANLDSRVWTWNRDR